MILSLLITLTLIYSTYSLLCLELNYRIASRMNIAIVRLPIDPLNTLWQIFEPLVWRLLNLLPVNWNTNSLTRAFALYSRRGWSFGDNADSHLHYGNAWAIVTPQNIWVQVADPRAINSIFKRRTDFLRPSEFYSEPSPSEDPLFQSFLRSTAHAYQRQAGWTGHAIGKSSQPRLTKAL